VGFQSLEINYAFAPQSDWGDVHRFDLTWRFGQEIAPEARRRELLKKGTTLVREGRILEARPVLDELETLSPKNRDVRSLVQESQKRFAESLDPEALMVLGQKTYGAGEYSTAADLFRKILLVDSAHDGARAWLKKTESKMEEVRNARLKKELDLSRQQELKKGIRLAERREAESDWGAALALWQKALALGGDSAKIQGRVQFCKEKLSEAAKHEEMRRQENARVAAESVNKLYKQGMEAYVAGELKKAKALFLEAQGLDSQNKNIRQALDHVEAELKLHPEKMRP
jgi:tetratricopeptide (TPR) repeat protein